MIKRIDPKAVTKVVSSTDEAVDLELSDTKAYASSLDLSFIKFKEGMKPTFFLVKNIGARRQAELKNKYYKVVPPHNDKEGKLIPAKVEMLDQTNMLIEYFETCVSQVEEDGKIVDISMDEIDFLAVQEIGGYAMLIATVGDNLKKTSKQ